MRSPLLVSHLGHSCQPNINKNPAPSTLVRDSSTPPCVGIRFDDVSHDIISEPHPPSLGFVQIFKRSTSLCTAAVSDARTPPTSADSIIACAPTVSPFQPPTFGSGSALVWHRRDASSFFVASLDSCVVGPWVDYEHAALLFLAGRILAGCWLLLLASHACRVVILLYQAPTPLLSLTAWPPTELGQSRLAKLHLWRVCLPRHQQGALKLEELTFFFLWASRESTSRKPNPYMYVHTCLYNHWSRASRLPRHLCHLTFSP